MEYMFEIHCHTAESSPCARESAASTVRAYKSHGYDGIVVTDHFVIGGTHTEPWAEKCAKQQAGYYAARAEGEKQGITVIYGAELTVYPYRGNDFLVYGLTPEWFYGHSELNKMTLNQVISTVRANGGFVSHAHPFRQADYIETITLIPDNIDAVEINANRTDFENARAVEYAAAYSKPLTAGTDNHIAHRQKRLFGMKFKTEIKTEKDLAQALFNNLFTLKTE